MSTSHPLEAAIKELGLQGVARACSVTYQAVRKWRAIGRLPRTEWTGETQYAAAIERAMAGRVTRAMLLAPWPDPQQAAARPARKAAATTAPDTAAHPAVA